MNKERLRDTLLTSIRINRKTECWEWARQLSNAGFGRLKMKNDDGIIYIESAARASYMAFCGDISRDTIVRSTCGNRLCINPQHLKIA